MRRVVVVAVVEADGWTSGCAEAPEAAGGATSGTTTAGAGAGLAATGGAGWSGCG